MRLRLARQSDALLDEVLDVARSVVAALGVEAEEIRQWPTDRPEVIGKAKQFEKLSVPGYQTQFPVENTETLCQVREPPDNQIDPARLDTVG